MAELKLCNIGDCSKPAAIRGWCWAHYRRWLRYGNPLAGTTMEGAPQRFLEDVAIPFAENDCLIWPYSKGNRGYGVVWYRGRMRLVHRIVCEAKSGPPPTPKHEVAHNCGKGHEGCCNPRHLRWATSKENHADRVAHGTSGRGERSASAKLTTEQVRTIRQLCKTKTQAEVARTFGVTPQAIHRVLRHKAWAWLD